MKTSASLPQKGFYRHYKHDPVAPFGNYTYEVVGMGRDTESETLSVLYRPLYVNKWLKPAEYNVRPLEMFMESVTKDGKTLPRFSQVTDSEVIERLRVLRDEMYG